MAVVLAGISLCNALDQTVLPAVVASIQAEFRLSDGQVGLLLSAPVLAIALAAMPLGYWADRGTRRSIIGLGTAVWSLATLVTGLVHAFPQMLAARTVLGIGEASLFPAGTSLIGDYFSKRTRGRAMAAVIAAGGLGIGGGLILGGAIGLRFGWRGAFYFAAAPGLVLALLALTIREPLRGSAEAAGPKLALARDAGMRAFGRLLTIRTYVAVLGASMCGNFGFAVFSLTPLYLHRHFGLDIARAGALTGVPMLAGVVVGVPVIGWLLDWRGRRSSRAAVEVGFSGVLLAGVAAIVMFSAPSVVVFEAGMIVSSLVSGAAALTPSIVVQNAIVPSLRGRAVSTTVTTSRLFGALGPVAVGVLSELVHRDLGLSLLLLIPSAFAGGAICFALGLASMKGDVESMEESWARREASAPGSPASAAIQPVVAEI